MRNVTKQQQNTFFQYLLYLKFNLWLQINAQKKDSSALLWSQMRLHNKFKFSSFFFYINGKEIYFGLGVKAKSK